jgi:hypothetical protein
MIRKEDRGHPELDPLRRRRSRANVSRAHGPTMTEPEWVQVTRRPMLGLTDMTDQAPP